MNVKLKQWHADHPQKAKSLAAQEHQLQGEIDAYMASALTGEIPLQRIAFAANKIFRKKGHEVKPVSGEMGQLLAQLAEANCRLWHVQEKVYEFHQIPPAKKNGVINQLAVLNLERTKCIEAIDLKFLATVKRVNHPPPQEAPAGRPGRNAGARRSLGRRRELWMQFYVDNNFKKAFSK